MGYYGQFTVVKKDKKTIWFTDLSTYGAFTAVKRDAAF